MKGEYMNTTTKRFLSIMPLIDQSTKYLGDSFHNDAYEL